MNQKLKEYRPNGILFFIREGTSDQKSIDEVVLEKGYERFRPIRFTVEAGETWFDFGANVGGFSSWALHKGAEKVIAYEPDPENFEVLQLNLGIYEKSRYELHRGAVVADERQTATLHQNTAKGNVWRNSIERPWQGGSQVTVPCVNVLDALGQVSGPLNIKMDIEGSEMPVLEQIASNRAILARINKLTFEWSFDVDPDLKRFRKVLYALKDGFKDVVPTNDYAGVDSWPASWFPPCKTLFCKK